MPKMHYFPSQYARRDFPLLFPKSIADDIAIRSIAQEDGVDYNRLLGELDLIQSPVESKQVFRKRFDHFKEGYRALWEVIGDMGEQYGVELSRYDIHKPGPKLPKKPRKYFPLLHPKSSSDEEVIRLIAASYGIDYDALVEGSKVVEPLMREGRGSERASMYFRSEYGKLEQIILREGEKHGVDPREYGIKPASSDT